MSSIFEIYFRDVKRVVTNWAALMIIIGLIIMPSMYAWFNIKSSWDPYGNTKGLKIAIVNEDRGATVLNNKINIGNEVIHSLKQNPSLGWRFTSKKVANEGVKQGKYYASILIPNDFSNKISTVLTDHPQKPELVYQVNEKLNIVAPKYTEKGATGIASEITKKFEKTVSKEVLQEFNKIGIDLQANLPEIKKFEQMVFKLEKDLPEIKTAVNTALNDYKKVQSVIQTTKKDMELINNIVANGEKLTASLSGFFNQINKAIQDSTPFIKQTLNLLQNQSVVIQSTLSQLQNQTISQDESMRLSNDIGKVLPNSRNMVTSLNQVLQSFNSLGTTADFSKDVSSLKDLEADLMMIQNENTQLKSAIQSGNGLPNDLLQKMNESAANINNKINSLTGNFDQDLAPKISEASRLVNESLKNTQTVLADAKTSIPTIKGVLQDTSNLLATKKGDIQQLVNELPMIEAKIKQIANEIRKAKEKGSIEDLINFLRTDIEKVSDFYSSPIQIKTERMFPIPNYGTGLTPFYTTLSLWVGALLMVSLLTTEVHEEKPYKSREVYFGRLLTFITIGVLQTLVVTTGNFLILGTYAASKGYFILFALLISIVFTFIVYTLVSVFGNIGKGIGIIFLVLQISGAGGVYPIQVTPPFFQKINPFLPFTYALSLLREATGGIVWETIYKDLPILVLFVVIAIIVGVVLKATINKRASKIADLSKKSRLIH
ncbi:YhgE/Pip domain-containing protein [Bacillus sp. AFS053548]|uniref:YhgE/Pip domain-containing protein n=1 Tax=Bacillus sp. AFS053548 TaxID=2033505 RepID=UPI000BFBA932|nr:YhgE/Pip domain-containing protein [Bacillus sp. AFS053548]PGM59239.1 YhgE/Pip [Bacillus sp. AFS053548]